MSENDNNPQKEAKDDTEAEKTFREHEESLLLNEAGEKTDRGADEAPIVEGREEQDSPLTPELPRPQKRRRKRTDENEIEMLKQVMRGVGTATNVM